MSDRRLNLEEQLFTWQEWDENGPGGLIFYDCALKVPVGNHSAGTNIPVIHFFMEGSMLQLNFNGADNEPVYEVYEILVTPGARIEC